MQTFELYPKCKKQSWIKEGISCRCSGEGVEIFIIDKIYDRVCELVTIDGYGHGCESFTKLSKVKPIELKDLLKESLEKEERLKCLIANLEKLINKE